MPAVQRVAEYLAWSAFERLFVVPAVSKQTVDRFFSLFLEMDKDATGVVDLDEFYRFFELERSPFADRVFSIMGERVCLQGVVLFLGGFRGTIFPARAVSSQLRRFETPALLFWNFCDALVLQMTMRAARSAFGSLSFACGITSRWTFVP